MKDISRYQSVALRNAEAGLPVRRLFWLSFIVCCFSPFRHACSRMFHAAMCIKLLCSVAEVLIGRSCFIILPLSNSEYIFGGRISLKPISFNVDDEMCLFQPISFGLQIPRSVAIASLRHIIEGLFRRGIELFQYTLWVVGKRIQ